MTASSLISEDALDMDVMHYITVDGRDPAQEWLDSLADHKARIAILRRIDRLIAGNFGDHKHCRSGVWELRVDVGPGYRVYYGKIGKTVVLLLCGGSKQSQAADISRAVDHWQDYRQRQR